MKEIKISCNYNVLDDFKYEIFENNNLIFIARVDFFKSIIKFIKESKLYHSIITLENVKTKEKFMIYRHLAGEITGRLFTIDTPNKTFYIKIGNNLKIPNLYIRTNLGRLDIRGEVKDSKFFILHKDKIISSIVGKVKEDKKIYTITYEDEYECDFKNLFILICLSLDSIYHNY